MLRAVAAAMALFLTTVTASSNVRPCWTPATVLHSYANMIVLLFCRNHFIDVYCHMLIAALQFVLRRSSEIVLRTLYTHACREIRAASDTWLST